MNTSCTILIPTHNRHQYLERCVRWFLALPYPIVIADSSTTAWHSSYRSHERVRYIHVAGGNDVYISKLQKGLAAVETPLVTMCADDDFITAEGIAASVSFLETHSDYAFAQGYAYFFQRFGNCVVAWPIAYRRHDLVSNDWIDRVEQARSTAYYGVNRSAALRATLDFLARQDFTEILDALPGFIDMCITTSAARAGKFRRVPVPFGLREYSPYMSAAGTRPATIVSRRVPDFYRHLVDSLMANERSSSIRNRLLRLCSQDYAGQIMYDLAGGRSKKRFVEMLGPAFTRRAEFLYRVYTAVRAYASFTPLSAINVFWHPEYRRFREFVLSTGVQ